MFSHNSPCFRLVVYKLLP